MLWCGGNSGGVEMDQPLRPSRHWQIEEPHFIPLEDLASIDLYPPIAIEILEDAHAKWQGRKEKPDYGRCVAS